MQHNSCILAEALGAVESRNALSRQPSKNAMRARRRGERLEFELAELLPAKDGGGGGKEEEGELPVTDGEGGGEEEEGEPKSRRGKKSRGDQNRMWDPGGKLFA